MPMDSLNRYQVKTLKRLANSSVKFYCCPAGLPIPERDDVESRVTGDFNDILVLVLLGLLDDVSTSPQHAGKVEELMALEGRDVVITKLSRLGQAMFERVKWEKWVN